MIILFLVLFSCRFDYNCMDFVQMLWSINASKIFHLKVYLRRSSHTRTKNLRKNATKSCLEVECNFVETTTMHYAQFFFNWFEQFFKTSFVSIFNQSSESLCRDAINQSQFSQERVFIWNFISLSFEIFFQPGKRSPHNSLTKMYFLLAIIVLSVTCSVEGLPTGGAKDSSEFNFVFTETGVPDLRRYALGSLKLWKN